MENYSTSERQDIIKKQIFKVGFNGRMNSSAIRGNSTLFETLSAEKCEMFFHYIDWSGLAKDPNLMVLSLLHHYYYDYEDLKGLKAIINPKLLNNIRKY